MGVVDANLDREESVSILNTIFYSFEYHSIFYSFGYSSIFYGFEYYSTYSFGYYSIDMDTKSLLLWILRILTPV